MNYEKLSKIEYEALHYKYEQAGLNIPNGSEVELTDWAEQNGLDFYRGKKYFKIRNGKWKSTVDKVYVIKEGSKYLQSYWAGFIKAVSPPSQEVK